MDPIYCNVICNSSSNQFPCLRRKLQSEYSSFQCNRQWIEAASVIRIAFLFVTRYTDPHVFVRFQAVSELRLNMGSQWADKG